MPKRGEQKTAYCQKCKRATTWIYVNWVVQRFWLCLTCESRETA